MDKRNRDSLKTRKIVDDTLLQNSKVAKASDLSTQRRKLIKASAAVVPAIMTLRSGAAAAMTSSAHRCLTNEDTPINLEGNVEGIDPVLGDEQPPLPLDDYLRVMARPGQLAYYSSGGSNNKQPYYFTRIDGATDPWDDIAGWRIFKKDGTEKTGQARTNLLYNRSDGTPTTFVTDAWSNRIAFYGVYDYPSGMVFVYEPGSNAPAVGDFPPPAFVSNLMQTSTTHVFLICYYNPNNGVVTYYPMQRDGDALEITGSCLCSINPAFQI